MTQQLDQFGAPLAGGLLYFIEAGTTSTPQNAFQDSALTIPWANPITLDARARVPQLFFADGLIKIRLTDKNGVEQLVADNIQVIGASSGGGGGGTVDPTTILTTGDIKATYGTGVITGFVRANGRTIGSATSGATERANLDCQALFEYLWNTDGSLAVSGGRGASAAADWTANKTIALPDFRGRVLASFDDMGSSAAGRLTTTTMNGTGIGAVSKASETETLITANLPAYTPSGSVTVTGLALQTRGFSTVGSNDSTTVSLGNSGGTLFNPNGQPFASGSAVFVGNGNGGLSTPFSIVQPTIFVTTYIKL